MFNMKFLKNVTFLLVIFIAYTAANCPNKPSRGSCRGFRDLGTRGPHCIAATRWYYNQQQSQCMEMRYSGCGGNPNRWCSKAACEAGCTRRP